LYRSWPLFLWLKALRQPRGGADDRRKDQRAQGAKRDGSGGASLAICGPNGF
jgi:hypothetical protein